MKIVMVVNNELPVGLVANTTAVLGIRLGSEKKEIIGPDCLDATKIVHKGITNVSIPILATDGDNLKSIYRQGLQNHALDVIDFNQIAQGCRNYSDYTGKLLNADSSDLEFSGLCLSGPKKEVEKLTGSLGLYR
jgi:hypothetical protein